MDQIKLLVKDVLHKIQDIPDMPFTSVRMSELSSRSSLLMDRYRSVSEESVSNLADVTNLPASNNNTTTDATQSEEIPKQSHNGTLQQLLNETPQKLPNETPKQLLNEQLLNRISKQPSNEHSTHIIPNVIDTKQQIVAISSDLESLNVKQKGSRDSEASAPPNQSPLFPKAPAQPKIIMGKRALMRSRSGELPNDSAVVVHELVNERYQEKICHYVGRMYKRRISRESRGTDDDGTSSNYSTGSLKTPDSLYDGKSYFSLFSTPRTERDFDSLGSTDDLAQESTDLFNSTLNSNAFSTDLEYDSRKFLKNALGEVSFDSQSGNSNLAKSKFQFRSVDPVNQPSLLNRAESLYSSMRRSLRRACSYSEKKPANLLPVKNKVNHRDRCKSYTPDDFGSSENMMRELYVQNGIIFQVSKALAYCKSSNDLSSPQYIEAEKILLVASCHKESIQTALDAAEFGEKLEPNRGVSGTLYLSDLVYYLKTDCLTEEVSRSFDEYFVIVVTSPKTVLSSKVLVPDENGAVKSDRPFKLDELLTDFEVSVAIYSMKVKHVDKNHGGDVRNHKKDRKVPHTPSKGFFHLNHHKTSRKNLLVGDIASIKPSSFTLCGSCTVRCSDLQKTHFRMERAPLSSSLGPYFTACLTGDVKLLNRTCGFLTVGFEDKCHLVWNRRWCLLEGSSLKYWNYPSEEFTCNPVGVVDLTRAIEKSSPADRSICPRPKTLCLLIRNREDSVLTYFLSADTVQDKDSWLERINFVIGTLDAWNCLSTKEKVTAI